MLEFQWFLMWLSVLRGGVVPGGGGGRGVRSTQKNVKTLVLRGVLRGADYVLGNSRLKFEHMGDTFGV